MSEHNQKEPDPTNPDIIISDAVKKKKKISKKHILTVLGISILAIALLGVVIYHNNRQNITQMTPTDLVLNGHYDEAQSNLNKQASTGTNHNRSEAYAQKAVLALNEKKYNDAMTFSLEAEELYPTSNTAYIVALAYQNLGDKKQAIAFYHTAINRIGNNPSELQQLDIGNYQNAITSLGG